MLAISIGFTLLAKNLSKMAREKSENEFIEALGNVLNHSRLSSS